MRNYEFGEVMTDEDSLAHYGVKGMKWGQRQKGSSYDIKEARGRLIGEQQNLAAQRVKARKTHKSNRATEKAKLEKMKVDFLKNPDRVLAARLTRGEKFAAALMLTPVGAAGLITTTSAASRRIEYKQETGGYDKKK